MEGEREANMPRVLVTGAAGQLGQRLSERVPGAILAHRAGGTGVPGSVPLALDDADSCRSVVAHARPDWVIHGAAMTNVDGCEREPALAHAINAVGAGNLAEAAQQAGARFVYVSTDYVFDGTRGRYREDDTPNPLSAYGRSKLEGERLVHAAAPDAIIARTSVVYGAHKTNFVLWLVQELKGGRRVRIVEDQWVSPTLTTDLADQILALLQAGATGVFHTAGATSLSRLEMARHIARAFELDEDLIDPIRSSELSWLAPRPKDATLDTSKVSKYRAPLPFDDALRQLRRELAARGVS